MQLCSTSSTHYRIYFLVIRTNEAALNIQKMPFTKKANIGEEKVIKWNNLSEMT